MEQKLKTIFYAMGAMILAPQTLCAQSVNIEGLDSLRLSGSVGVVEPELLKKGVLNNALDALSGQTAGVNVTTNGLDRIAMLNSVRVRGTTSIMGGNDPLVIIDGVTSDVATLAKPDKRNESKPLIFTDWAWRAWGARIIAPMAYIMTFKFCSITISSFSLGSNLFRLQI